MFSDFSLVSARATGLVQLDYFIGFFFEGRLAAPLTHLLLFCWSCFRVTPILAGVIGVARGVVGAVLVFVFVLEQL